MGYGFATPTFLRSCSSPLSIAGATSARAPKPHAVPAGGRCISISRTRGTKVAAVRAVASSQRAARGTSTTAAAFDSVVMGTYTRYSVVLTHGSGATLWDIEGKSYIDCAAGIATCTLGHAHKGLQAAVSEQLGKLTHVSNLYYTAEQGYLAAWLVENSPCDKAFFCNSGGEANEAAIKLVRRYWHTKNPGCEHDTPVIICAKNAFHGRTLATITATGQPKYQRGFWPLVPGFVHVDYNDAAALEKAVCAAGKNFAGIMLEALQGEGGVNPGTHEFFGAARSLCDKHDALLVCDEVQVGVGRTGKLWGFENVNVQPDVFTLAKGLAGGVPIGAMLCKNSCDVLGPGDHASTFGGNLLACAAGSVVADALDNGLLNTVEKRGEFLRIQLENLAAATNGIVRQVRGWGLIRGVELADENAAAVVAQCINRGLLTVPAGTKVVRFVPPLIITEEEIEKAVAILKDVLLSI